MFGNRPLWAKLSLFAFSSLFYCCFGVRSRVFWNLQGMTIDLIFQNALDAAIFAVHQPFDWHFVVDFAQVASSFFVPSHMTLRSFDDRLHDIIALLYFQLQGVIQKFQDFIKKTKNWFSFANILLVTFKIVPFALNATILHDQEDYRMTFLGHPSVWR